MKRILSTGVVLIALMLSACGRGPDGDTAAPAPTTEPGAKGSQVSPTPTYAPYPTHTPQPTNTPPPAASAVESTPAAEPAATATPMPVSEPTPTEPPREPTATATSTPVPRKESAPAEPAPLAPAVQPVDLTRVKDTDPGPPLTIQVSTLGIKANGAYKLTGTVRNDSAEIYGGIGVIATFFTGAPLPNHHGPVEVYAACSLLSPGEACPFSLEIYARDYLSYLLHPKGAPVTYQPASLTLSELSVRHDNFGYVHIAGTATNGNLYAVRDATIYGTLIDAGGRIASVGMTLAPGQITPGARVAFDIRIEGAPYAHYEVRAQATRN